MKPCRICGHRFDSFSLKCSFKSSLLITKIFGVGSVLHFDQEQLRRRPAYVVLSMHLGSIGPTFCTVLALLSISKLRCIRITRVLEPVRHEHNS